MNVSQILEENEQRQPVDEYDPINGIGCAIDSRVPLRLTDDTGVYVPERCLQSPFLQKVQGSSLKHLSNQKDLSYDHLKQTFNVVRAAYDFEFWAASAVTIRTKTDGLVPFVLNKPQREYLRILLDDYYDGKPVRIILVKARQWGGSTLTQLFMAWVQLFHHDIWNIAIVADDQGQARHIRNMYRTLADNYPSTYGQITLKPYEGSQNTVQIKEKGSIIGVGSVKRPDAVRGYTFQMLHLSEVGLWKSTPVQSAEELAQSLEGGLPDEAYTICVMESTAKGVGNYFHREYQAAETDKSNYRPVFMAWHDMPEYRSEVEEPEAFIDSWSEYEEYLWNIGCSIEQIAWYRRKLKSMPSNAREKRMKEEFPSTAQEAFQGSGNPFFERSSVQRQRQFCTEPKIRGSIKAEDQKGEKAFENIHIQEHGEGRVYIWREPGDDYGLPEIIQTNDGYSYRRRYVAALDLGGKTESADFTCGRIIDRAPLMWGAPVELAAQFYGHLRPDLAIWQFAQLCSYYEKALLMIEINRMRHNRGDEDRGFEPEWSMATIEEIVDYYDNLYIREQSDKISDVVTKYIGFHMNQSTKPIIMNVMDEALEEHRYIERFLPACDEMDYFEQKNDGRLEHAEGQNDDIVDATAGGLYLALKYWDPARYPVVEVEPKSERESKKSERMDAATFR